MQWAKWNDRKPPWDLDRCWLGMWKAQEDGMLVEVFSLFSEAQMQELSLTHPYTLVNQRTSKTDHSWVEPTRPPDFWTAFFFPGDNPTPRGLIRQLIKS